MADFVTDGYVPRQVECNPVSLISRDGICHRARMARKAVQARHYIKEWRKHRGLTQEQLAERMGITREYVSMVEKGKRRYDQHFLESASLALSCNPADLIVRDPAQPNAIWSIWEQIPSTEREHAARVLETFARKKAS